MPLRPRAVETDFERSWDAIDAFYARDIEGVDLGPLRAFLAELRDEGFASKLRASQRLNALVLSRSTSGELGPGQSHLSFAPYPDGLVRIDGQLDGVTYRMNEVPAVYRGRIAQAVDRLAQLPLE